MREGSATIRIYGSVAWPTRLSPVLRHACRPQQDQPPGIQRQQHPNFHYATALRCTPMTTYLLNHIFHQSDKLSAAEQMRLARMLLDRIRTASFGSPALGKAPAAGPSPTAPGDATPAESPHANGTNPSGTRERQASPSLVSSSLQRSKLTSS